MNPQTPNMPSISPSPSEWGPRDSQDLVLECPTMPMPPSMALPPKPHQVTPRKSSKHGGKQDKELKHLINMVQALAQKLKMREGQVQQLQEKADKLIEVTLQLESAEARLVDAAAENHILSRRVNI
jgi:hypothetical protein